MSQHAINSIIMVNIMLHAIAIVWLVIVKKDW